MSVIFGTQRAQELYEGCFSLEYILDFNNFAGSGHKLSHAQENLWANAEVVWHFRTEKGSKYSQYVLKSPCLVTKSGVWIFASISENSLYECGDFKSWSDQCWSENWILFLLGVQGFRYGDKHYPKYRKLLFFNDWWIWGKAWTPRERKIKYSHLLEHSTS